ncbi:hypothetical protein B0H17DRAFT_1069652 [Mycena rosella]|uniref:Cytochrome b561 domain-containing protein n=1 Tax=Mycena rosella TaxID=1033263 RepID=A0AAD7DBU8_MYCRO|nr:hypothetical protein B0H17DRAFT_1069652 [Mycena rosella]
MFLFPLAWVIFYIPTILADESGALVSGKRISDYSASELWARKGPKAPLPPPNGTSPHFKALVIGHALLCVFGFAVLLPAGVFLARYLRTFRPWWYNAHWIMQAGIAGPVITIGVVLGYMASGAFGKTAGDNHKTYGSVLFYIYFAQCIFGALIHYVKPKNATRRPPQNYVHALLGLVILSLGMYQIRTGYHQEWPQYVGEGILPAGVTSLWLVWCILLPIAYGAGMYFIRLQYRQEAVARLRIRKPGLPLQMSELEV